MKATLKLLRVKHYIKNILIFIPFIFGTNLGLHKIENMFVAFFAFSFMASTIYILNDLKDVEKDRLHPVKKNRPIASGKVSKGAAITIAILLFIASVVLNFLASGSCASFIWLGIYFVLNLLYSLKLKEVPIIDIAVLVAFYIIRVYYGAAVATVPVSSWLFLTIMSAAMFLAFSKRRNELKRRGASSREVLKFYSLRFLDKFMYLSLAVTTVFYSLWAVEQENKCFAYTIPLLLMILIRYCLVIETTDNDDPVEIVTKDKMMLLFEIAYVLFGMGIVIFNILA
ncbi:MAG: UbiA prenyltransferase family protein [Clostridia bacterium]|nr:UbiA prenyltransferase family protein [Clostridia bacterium]